MKQKKQNKRYTHKDLQQLACKNRRVLQTEYLSLIQLLYATQVEENVKSIQSFYTMNMQDVTQEIKLRTMILKARNLGIARRQKEKDLEAENALLERLKRR